MRPTEYLLDMHAVCNNSHKYADNTLSFSTVNKYT